MPRKTKAGETDQRHGGYRHGVPGGAKATIQLKCTPDLPERWRRAAVKAGFHTTRGLSPFVVEAVEAYIKARKLEE
jgi:hypothetical protein